MRSQESEVVNFSCWGRCEEPCEEGASRVRAGQPGRPFTSLLGAGSQRPGQRQRPPDTAPFPGPVYSPWRGPRPRFLPPPLPGKRRGWVRLEPPVPRHPQAVGVRFKARPWWGAGCALYRRSNAPVGVHIGAPQVPRGGDNVS